jgi:FkbM family methyltransferase
MNDIQELPNTFQWGDGFPQDSIKYVLHEMFEIGVYDKYRQVKSGDIVMDIGSSTGPFNYCALKRGANHVYCIEPSETALKLNLINNAEFIINAKISPCVFINHAIGNETNLLKIDKKVHLSNNSQTSTISFKDMIDMYNINHIDFLKIDCEGGEYDIFVEDNIPFLRDHVDFIACELHGRYNENYIDRYNWIKENILPHFGDYRICCPINNKYTDITEFIRHHGRNSDYLIRQTELMLYISRNKMSTDESVFVLKI